MGHVIVTESNSMPWLPHKEGDLRIRAPVHMLGKYLCLAWSELGVRSHQVMSLSLSSDLRLTTHTPILSQTHHEQSLSIDFKIYAQSVCSGFLSYLGYFIQWDLIFRSGVEIRGNIELHRLGPKPMTAWNKDH